MPPGDALLMRLLLLNWRDPWHPKAGGAELMTLRLLEELQGRGWSVEWFSAAYDGAEADEVRDGIRYVRSGSQMTVHLHAYRRYRKYQPFDVVVDEINTIPFFTPLYVKAPHIALIYQLAREVWFYEASLPLAIAGYVSEPFYLQTYRRTPIATISASSARSFRRMGLRGPIGIVPVSCDEPAVDAVPHKTSPRDIVMVSRLAKSKRIHHGIEAAELLSSYGWRGRLHIVGRGDADYLKSLKHLAQRSLKDRVIFHGRVSDEQRRDILTEASVIWMTSRREGWGLVITEAARRGTPAVVYDVSGLCDAVEDGVTGYVTHPNPTALARATEKLLGDRYLRFAQDALVKSREFSWNHSADQFETILRDTIAAYQKNIT